MKKGLSCTRHPVCENWTLHKFRRTWATNHMLNGVPLPVIQQWIGHSDLETAESLFGPYLRED